MSANQAGSKGLKIAVLGSGSIGTYLGAALIAVGADVVLIGRARMQQLVATAGVRLSDLNGRSVSLSPEQINYTQEPQALADADLILVTVKSADTAHAGQQIAQFAKAGAMVISFQNGIGNAHTLRQVLPNRTVLGGMVPFNVVLTDQGVFHRATEGDLVLEAAPELLTWSALFAKAGLPLQPSSDFTQIQWGKLILNLNNAINSLSGLPLKAELSQQVFRRCLAGLIEEAVTVMRAAGIKPAKISKVDPSWLPTILRMPDLLFKQMAASMLRIDPEARSSMWDDLQAKRRTEVDYLNGAIVTLAESLGLDAPLNRRIVALIRRAEQGELSALTGEQLLSELYP